jgi:hypothetical protein
MMSLLDLDLLVSSYNVEGVNILLVAYPHGWSKSESCEVQAMMGEIATRVEIKNDGTPGSMWEFPLHSTWNHFFSGYQEQDWMGTGNYGQLAMTCNNCLPEGVPKKYMATKKTDTKMQLKVAGCNNLITAMKTV